MNQYLEFVSNHWDLFAALAIVLAMLIGPSINRRLRGFDDVDAQKAVSLVNHDDALLLDVREANEYSEGHILDSVHVPLSAFDKRVGELEKYKDRPIVVACRSGHRSARAAGILRKNAFEQVYNLRGGVLAWANAGLPLTKGGKKKNKG